MMRQIKILKALHFLHEICQKRTDLEAFFFRGSDLSTKLHGRTTEESRLGPAFRKIPYAFKHPMLEDENQNRGVFFSTFSFESNALD